MSAGGDHTCGVTTSGSMECWGFIADEWGTLLDTPSGTFATVSAGDSHTCGVTTSGSVECWGSMFPILSSEQSAAYQNQCQSANFIDEYSVW